MVMEWLKNTTASARATLTAEVSKFRNREFMEAVIAACALTAYADGNVSSDEKQKMIRYAGSADELKHFGSDKVIAFFQSVLAKFEFDVGIGRAEALKIIGKVRNNPEQARMVVRVAGVIASADGDFDEKEKAVIKQICQELGLNHEEFN